MEFLVGQNSDCRLGLFLDRRFTLGIAAPAGVDECAVAFHDFAEAIVGDAAANAVLLATLAGVDQHRLLNEVQQVGRVLTYRRERNRTLLAGIPADHHGLVLVEVAWTELEAERN